MKNFHIGDRVRVCVNYTPGNYKEMGHGNVSEVHEGINKMYSVWLDGAEKPQIFSWRWVWPPKETPRVREKYGMAALREILTDHIASLEGVGFGSDVDINGVDAVDAVNAHFEALRDALASIRE